MQHNLTGRLFDCYYNYRPNTVGGSGDAEGLLWAPPATQRQPPFTTWHQPRQEPTGSQVPTRSACEVARDPTGDRGKGREEGASQAALTHRAINIPDPSPLHRSGLGGKNILKKPLHMPRFFLFVRSYAAFVSIILLNCTSSMSCCK